MNPGEEERCYEVIPRGIYETHVYSKIELADDVLLRKELDELTFGGGVDLSNQPISQLEVSTIH